LYSAAAEHAGIAGIGVTLDAVGIYAVAGPSGRALRRFRRSLAWVVRYVSAVSLRPRLGRLFSPTKMECVMLVLTRKQGERIQIGQDVVITVVRTKGKSVRLGIQAPSHVPVLRGEIAIEIAAEEQQKTAVDDGGESGVWSAEHLCLAL
jgi:carbon storage regulator